MSDDLIEEWYDKHYDSDISYFPENVYACQSFSTRENNEEEKDNI